MKSPSNELLLKENPL